MQNFIVRIESIEITNFKNVKFGKLNFQSKKSIYDASILGLYGQNGSGKTAVIDAISLLKSVLMGMQIPATYSNCINVDAKYSQFKYKFRIYALDEPEKSAHVIYEFKIKKENDENHQNISQENFNSMDYKIVLFDELLSFSFDGLNNKKTKMQPIINTQTDGVFLPKSKYEIIVGKGKNTNMEMLVAKKITFTTSRSFVFSKEFLSVVHKNCTDKNILLLIEILVKFGNYDLFVIDAKASAIVTLNILPITFKNNNSYGSFAIPVNEPAVMPQHIVDIAKNNIDKMNIVLPQLVPGLTISIKDFGEQMGENGVVGHRIQLISAKNGKEIPLEHESEGIKKIISILNMLILVYNESSITVAIDELDSGIFEYLLGEILRIISERGKGQLVFTSHNLRPLETLDKGFIAFTTSVPTNRYIRITGLKNGNNLRDFYYRDIMLGEQDIPIYSQTNNSEIALAFREAGGIRWLVKR